MDKAKILKLLELIDDLVHKSHKTWKEKQQAILEEASETDKINLDEFCGWFDDA